MPSVILYLGAASYSLYLFHPMIAPLAPEALQFAGVGNPVLSVVSSIVLSLAVSALIYRWIEKPVTRWLSVRLEARKPLHARP